VSAALVVCHPFQLLYVLLCTYAWTVLFCIYYYCCCCTVCTALLFSYSAISVAASVRNKLTHSFIHSLISCPFKTFSVLFSSCARLNEQLVCQFSSANHASYHISYLRMIFKLLWISLLQSALTSSAYQPPLESCNRNGKISFR